MSDADTAEDSGVCWGLSRGAYAFVERVLTLSSLPQGPATPALSGRNSGSGGPALSGGSSGNSGGGGAAALQETVHDSAAEKAARVKEKNRHALGCPCHGNTAGSASTLGHNAATEDLLTCDHVLSRTQ